MASSQSASWRPGVAGESIATEAEPPNMVRPMPPLAFSS